MLGSVRNQILAGFGVIMLMLAASTAMNVQLLSAVRTDFDMFRSRLDQRSQAVDMDLVMQKVRVRVNQWLRSMNPDFAKQADELLAQDSILLNKAAASGGSAKRQDIIGDISRALTAYTESWRVIQSLYAEQDRIYDERIIKPSAALLATLTGLRDDETQERAISMLIGQARDGFLAAETWAFRYKASSKQADADQFTVAITEALGALTRAQAAATVPGVGEHIKQAASALGQWQAGFQEATRVGQTRMARLASWTSKEGEAMAVGANLLRSEDEAAAASAQAGVVKTITNSGIHPLPRQRGDPVRWDWPQCGAGAFGHPTAGAYDSRAETAGGRRSRL
jgi:hypothetical protein